MEPNLIEKIFYLAILLFLTWVLKVIFIDTQHKAKNNADQNTPETIKKQYALRNKFEGAIRFLKKTIISKQGNRLNLANLPWYLLIGSEKSGKTTLLTNSNINFILAKQFKQDGMQTVPPSDSCDWWVTRDLVIIDTPGNYIASKDARESHRASLNNVLWDNLLQLIKKHRAKQSLSGIMITLSLPDLMKHSQKKNKILFDIKNRITELRNRFGHALSFHLIITKCDLLSGFTEFFSDSGSDELSDAWGVILPAPKENENLLQIFSSRFNALIKRINKQLICRLHQERDMNSRPYIKDFPLQIERLKEAILHALNTLDIPDLRLQGVYLTSGAQQPTHNLTTQNLQTIVNNQALATQTPTLRSKAYFIRQLLLQGLLHHSDHIIINTAPKKIHWQHYTAAGLVTSVVLVGSVFFYHNTQTTKQTERIARYQALQHEKNPARLYAMLKTYLLLPEKLNSDSIVDARKQLLSLPNSELAYIILKNSGSNHLANIVNIDANQAVLVSKEVQTQISNMFTAKTLQTILTQDIPTAAAEALQGNDIIGTRNFTATPEDIAALSKELRALYIANYIDTWEGLLANIRLEKPNDIAQMDAMLVTLTSDNSPLLQLLKTIKQNTAIEPILSASPKLQALNLQENALYQIFVNLRQLHTYLQTVLTTSDINKAAFQAAALRMEHPQKDAITNIFTLAEQNQAPIKTWLNSIAAQTWHTVLQSAAQYTENEWRTKIIPIYHSQLINNYPFKEDATQEVDPQQFSSFLGQQGTLAVFYRDFLKPFIKDPGKTWRTVDNQTIPFSEKILFEFKYAGKIQRIFFPSGNNKLSNHSAKYLAITEEPIDPPLAVDLQEFHLSDSLLLTTS